MSCFSISVSSWSVASACQQTYMDNQFYESNHTSGNGGLLNLMRPNIIWKFTPSICSDEIDNRHLPVTTRFVRPHQDQFQCQLAHQDQSQCALFNLGGLMVQSPVLSMSLHHTIFYLSKSKLLLTWWSSVFVNIGELWVNVKIPSQQILDSGPFHSCFSHICAKFNMVLELPYFYQLAPRPYKHAQLPIKGNF